MRKGDKVYVYVCQGHPYDGGEIFGVFDSIDSLKKYMEDNKDNENDYLIPDSVYEVEMNKSYQSYNSNIKEIKI